MVYHEFRSSFLMIGLLVAAVTSFAGGQDALDKAEKLFNKRGESLGAIEDAKEAYWRILQNKREEHAVKTVALDRFARLSVFQGEIAKEKFAVREPGKIFKKCIEATDTIKEKVKKGYAQSAEYVYWRTLCMGLWAANASNFEIIRNAKMMTKFDSLLKDGLEKYSTFDEHGFERMLAGVFLRSKGVSGFNFYNPERALSTINGALRNGTNNYMGYVMQAEALIALHRNIEAIQVLTKAKENLEARLILSSDDRNALPPVLMAENIMFLEHIKRQLDQLK